MINFLGSLMGSILRVVYNIVSGIGTEPTHVSYYAIAVIITSIIFKLLLLPININQTKSSKKMNEIQPKLKEIQTKYKNDPQTMQVKMQQLYKDNNYNPMSGCLVLLIQFPIIFAFFAVFRDPAKYAFTEPGFYEAMNKSFLWISNLEKADPFLWGLPLLAALTTYLQTKTMPTQNLDPQTQATQKTMNYFLPVMIFISARSFAAGLALYWVLSNLFTIVQQLLTNRSLSKVKEEK